jgi:hypothetical protein
MNELSRALRVPSLPRSMAAERVNVVLSAVFVLAAAFYVWTAATTQPLALTGGAADPYNQLATSFLHLRLSVGHVPAGLSTLFEPYNPAQNGPFQGQKNVLELGIHDFAFYHGKLFLTWGPAPVLVLLVPLHLLGLEPTASVTVSIFAIAGLGFALAALRLVLRQIGEVSLWMCALAALTLALASAVPYILRRPAVYEEEICGGYCFAMAGVWLAFSALVERRASLPRLALMSLCIGLAIGSRPTLVFTAVLLVLVYLSLRDVRPRRGLLVALAAPLGVCILLLLVYNQLRFGSPLENGAKYQLGVNQYLAHYGSLSYVPPGIWFYGVGPPRIASVFPFVILAPPPVSYPGTLPGLYPASLEQTGGLLAMAPIVVFVVALPWMWRKRATALGRLSLPLLALVGAALACVLFLSYEFFATTERYEVDFTPLLLLAALAVWLALAHHARGGRRRLVRGVGGVLAVWSCLAGLAISFTGYYNLLATNHPGIWKGLQEVTSPLSTAIAAVEGHALLAEVSAAHLPTLTVGEQAHLIVVSPDSRSETLLATLVPAVNTGEGTAAGRYESAVTARGSGTAGAVRRIPAGGVTVRIALRLHSGLNRVVLAPIATDTGAGVDSVPAASQMLFVKNVSLAPG